MAMPWTLSRMLFRDAAMFCLAGIGIITPLALLLLLMQLMYKLEGIGASTLFSFIPLLALYYQPYLIPICVLAATAAAYGRFSGDREFTALMTSGCPPRRILLPALLIGLVAAIPAAYATFEAAPQVYTKRDRLARQALVDVINNPPPGARELSFKGNEGQGTQGIHISYQGVQDGVFERLVILFTKGGKLQGMLSCDRGELRFGEESAKLSLANARDAVYLSFDEQGRVGGDFPVMRADVRLAEYPIELYGRSGRISAKAERAGEHFEWLQRDLVAMHAEESGTIWEFVRRTGLSLAPILLAVIGAMAALMLQHSPRIIQIGLPLVGGITGFFSTQAVAKAICAQNIDGMTKLVLGIGIQTVPLIIVIIILMFRISTAREPRPLSAMVPAWLRRRTSKGATP